MTGTIRISKILRAVLILLTVIASSDTTLLGSAGQSFQIKDLVQGADLIVVGQIQSATVLDSGWLITVSVDRTLKGTAHPGSSLHVQFDFPRGYRGSKNVSQIRALWFLRQGPVGGQWLLLPAETGHPWFESSLYEIKSPTAPKDFLYTDATSTLDKVISEIAQAAEDFGGAQGYGDRLPLTLGPGDSPLLTNVYHRWAASTSTNLQALGLMGLLAQDNADAMVAFAAKASEYAASPVVVPLMAAVNEFRNTRVDAVNALGTLAVTGPPAFRLRAAYALRGIHTPAALPYLNTLLDSTDPQLREDAIEGFSAFALGMPAAKSGMATAEAMDAALNPANQKHQTPSIRANAHFGPFSSLSEEVPYIQFWKSWYATNAAPAK